MTQSSIPPPASSSPAHPTVVTNIADLASILQDETLQCKLVSWLDHLTTAASAEETELVVLRLADAEGETIRLIRALSVIGHRPDLIAVVSGEIPASAMAHLLEAGVKRVLVDELGWDAKLAVACRHLLRERKRQERYIQLRSRLTQANALLEEKNRRLDEFCSTVAHDIRGPLGGIAMKLEYLLELSPEPLPEKTRGVLDRALGSTRRVVEMVKAMYDFAKLGEEAMTMEPVPLAELVEQVVSDLPVPQGREVSVGLSELPTVWGNRQLLMRVFLNLISNAVKYSDKPHVIINVGKRSSTRESLGAFAEIFVSDNGPGIPSTERERIFMMFSRGLDAAKAGEGTGVGLAVVRRIAELHFGHVWVESEEGKGATFVMKLPTERFDLHRTGPEARDDARAGAPSRLTVGPVAVPVPVSVATVTPIRSHRAEKLK